MNALVILDYNRGEVNIIQNVPDLKDTQYDDWEAYIQGTLHYKLENIEWMFLDICKDEPLPVFIKTLL